MEEILMVYPDQDRKTVHIKHNHVNPRQAKKKREVIISSVVICAAAALILAGTFLGWGAAIAGGFARAGDVVASLFSGGAEEKDSSSSEAASDSGDSQDTSQTQQQTQQQLPVTVTLTGDVDLSPYVTANYDAGGIDAVVAPDLRSQLTDSDILEINHEFALTNGGTAADKTYTLRADPSYVSILTDLGVDVAGLANNHTLDFGAEGLNQTFATLSGAGISYTGAGTSLEDASKLVVIEKNGRKIGFLAASRVIPYSNWDVRNAQPGIFTCYDPTDLIADVSAAKASCDDLFVCVHWGTERTTQLSDYQTQMAHQLIDAGADAVIGAHPHVLQGMEYYNGKLICYSLGNFIFNQTIDQTAAMQFTIASDGTISARAIPAFASSATTQLASGDTAAAIYQTIANLSPTVSVDFSSGNITPAAQ